MNLVLLASINGEPAGPLKRYADSMQALVVDVRHNPLSRHAEWCRAELEKLYFPGPSRYVWAQSLAYLGRSQTPKEFCNAAIGMQALMLWHEHFPLIVICACTNSDSCVRGGIGQVLESFGIEVRELQWPKRKPVFFKQDPAKSVQQIQEALAEQREREAEATRRKVVQEVLL